jgi:hypothetical protein
MIRIFLALLLCVFPMATGICSDREMKPEEISEFLNRLEEKDDREKPRRIEFREEKFSPMFRDPVIATGTLWFAPPDRFRREVVAPDPSTVVGNGEKLWLFYPDFKEVEEYALDGKFPFAREMEIFLSGLSLRDLPDNFRIRAWKESAGGIRMELRPRGGGRSGIERIVVSMGADAFPHTLEIFSRDGNRSLWHVLASSIFEPGEDLFAPSIPPGWRLHRPLEGR